jgi:hypothetical protein
MMGRFAEQTASDVAMFMEHPVQSNTLCPNKNGNF